MNEVDLFIIVVIGACAVSGARRGLISSAGDIISLLLGLVLGALAYPVVEAPLRWLFSAPPTISGPLALLAVAVATVLLAGWGFSTLAGRFDGRSPASRAGGGVFGMFLGVVLAAVLILVSGVIPGAAEPVQRSALGPRIVVVVPRLETNLDLLGVPMPKLVQLPEDYRDELSGVRQGLQFMRVNFARLDGATCINCGAPVRFLGYQFSRGTLLSPKFECTRCGRTSDGCQTFEGFHLIYGQCPVALAEQGVEFDCGVWTNGSWTVPKGVCPICGKEYRGQRPRSRVAASQQRRSLVLSRRGR